MAWNLDKETKDLVWSAVEQGIAPSPLKGIANIQNANISTELGEVMTSYGRVQQSQAIVTSGTITASSGMGSFYLASNVTLQVGTWITFSAVSISGFSINTPYYVTVKNNGLYQLAANYDPSQSTGISHGTSGTGTFTTYVNMGSPVAYAIENFNNGSGQQNRYYVLDAQGLIWVYDTAVFAASLFNTGVGTTWFLPDFSTGYFSGGTAPSGIAVIGGWLFVGAGLALYAKSTVNLGGTTSNSSTWGAVYDSTGNPAILMSIPSSLNPHTMFVGHQGKLYYCDGNYIGEIFPDTSINPNVTGLPNIQSFCSYGAATTTGTIGSVISGSVPWDGVPDGQRVPAVFFTTQSGTQPSNLTAGTVYYIQYDNSGVFNVYAAATGGSAINIASGASGTQYFNTFWPRSMAATQPVTFTLTTQRVNLPENEIAQCMAEVGNTVIIGGIGNIIYPWNQIDATPSSLIALPENHTYNMVTVNQMVYIFAGNKGNVYITDGSVASLVIKVPDYCVGVPASPSTYIEPYFTWGGAAYIRGRVYFSILDQTASKAGNCGGIWSFVPTQNLYIGQDTGLALRLENQNSYGTYNGVAPLIIPFQTQNALSPQYFSAWYSSVSNPLYGIDFTGTFPNSPAIIETDLLSTGTYLDKGSFSNVEYKLNSPLLSGETVTINYRESSTAAWQSISATNFEQDPTNPISGVFKVNFQNLQRLQLQPILTPNGSSTFSGIRLTELRLR